jgi:hypothetical protein
MRRFVPVLTLLAACGDDAAAPDAAVPIDSAILDANSGPDADLEEPATLAETGLCVDAACTQISPGILEYEPEYALWSDAASKRRWIQLPAGSQIDTSDMDLWQFPEGTKLWKEFTSGTTRVETRILQKIGPDPTEWYVVSFAWNEAQDEALAVPLGVEDALGTSHDIPSRSDCRRCHDRLEGKALGFQAILLDHDGPGLTLDDLVAQDLLTVEPTEVGGGEYFPLPGTAVEQAALGYLHVNCGNCHNPGSDVQNTVAVDWRLRVGTLASVAGTPAYTTAVGVAPTLTNVTATSILEPGDITQSSAYLRMNTTQAAVQMPPEGRETIDTAGAATLQAWIEAL